MFQNHSVLYYPTIEIQSDKWLKTNILLWDHIYRIVPKGYTPKDSLNTKICIEKNKIRSIVLEKDDLTQAANEFEEFIKNLHFIPEGLENNSRDRLHRNKIDDRLYPIIEKYAEYCDPEGFYLLDKGLARGYMFHLANTVATRRNIEIVTDNQDAWTAMTFFSENANFSKYFWDSENAKYFYTSLIFKDILPANIENINIEKIINFVSTHKDERNRFISVLSSIAKEISKCKSKEHLEIIREDFKKEILQAKNDYKRSSGFQWKDFSSSFLVVGIPAGLALYESLKPIDNPFEITSLLPSVLYCAVASYLDAQKAIQAHREKPKLSYLVDIEKEIDKKRYRQTYKDIFRQFMND